MSEWRDISGNNSIWCMGDPQNPEAYIFREKSGNWQWHAAGKTGMKTKRHLAMNAAAREGLNYDCENGEG